MSFYLEKIHNTYYFRLRVPKDLVPYLGTNQLRKSLRTSKFANAKSLVRGILFATERLFVSIRSGMLTREQIIKMVADFRNEHLEKQENKRRKIGKRAYYPTGLIALDIEAKGDLPFSPTEINDAIISLNRAEAERLNNLLLDNDFTGVTAIARRLLKENKITPDIPEDDLYLLCEYVLKALIDICNVKIERIKGNYNNPFFLQASQDPPPHSAVPSKPTYKLSELWEEYKRTKQVKGQWTLGTLEKNDSGFKTIIDILGDKSLVEFDDESVLAHLLESLKIYPRNKNKLKAFSGKKYSPNMAKEKGFTPIGNETIKFTMGLMSSLLKFACNNPSKWGISANLAAGFTTKDKRNPSEIKSEYTKDDIEGLFRELAILRKRILVEPERFWIPLIALYSGARLNEICQLRTEDIVDKEGVQCIKIQHKPGLKQQVKTKESRSFPVHPTLIKLGLLEYVRKMQGEKQDRLWPNLREYKGKWHTDFGKWYNRTIEPKFTGKDKTKSFHSMRHSFINWFKQNMLKDEIKISLANLQILKSIVGHLEVVDRSILGMGRDITLDRYGKDFSPSAQLKLLRNLDYCVDLKLLERRK